MIRVGAFVGSFRRAAPAVTPGILAWLQPRRPPRCSASVPTLLHHGSECNRRAWFGPRVRRYRWSSKLQNSGVRLPRPTGRVSCGGRRRGSSTDRPRAEEVSRSGVLIMTASPGGSDARDGMGAGPPSGGAPAPRPRRLCPRRPMRRPARSAVQPRVQPTTLCFCSPRPAMPSAMTSPGLRKTGGFMPRPTPGGVPVVMTSPGSSTMKCEM